MGASPWSLPVSYATGTCMHVDRQMKNNFKEAEELPCNDIYKTLRFVIAIKLRTGGSYTHFLKWACETRLWQGIHVLGRYIRTCDVVLASQLAPA